MNSGLKCGLLVVAMGFAMHANQANAAVATHLFRSNAVNYCQAFTPGPSNTIRNRVVGAENIGGTIAVACNFHSLANGGAGVAPPRTLDMWFANNNASGTITVTCTLLTGYQSEGGTTQYSVSKTTAAIPAGGATQENVTWTQTDNPVAGSTSLGNYIIGVNCTLPTGAVMNDTYLFWAQDNGI